MIHARLHPGPLAQGEGKSFAVAAEIVRRRLQLPLTPKSERSDVVPSPGGEGQGEGERLADLTEQLHREHRASWNHFVEDRVWVGCTARSAGNFTAHRLTLA